MRTEVVLDRRREERRVLLDRARRFVDGIPVEGLQAVVVFGSVARGDFNLWSDIDVLVVTDDADGPPRFRADALGAAPGDVQVVVWNTRDWAAARLRSNPIVEESLTTGIWLRGVPADLP